MRCVPALLITAMLVSSPAWSQIIEPCSTSTRIPVTFQVARPICAGQPLRLVAGACGPCVRLNQIPYLPPGPIQIGAVMDLNRCIPAVCLPETLSIPIGSFAPGNFTVVVQVLGTIVGPDSSACHVVQQETVTFTVPATCGPPGPLPYTRVIEVGPPPICPQRPIGFHIAGALPNNCWEFRRLELLPSPIAGPLPAPPIARVIVAKNDCLRFACNDVPVPWEASARLPGLPGGNYGLIVQLAEVSWCDSTAAPDTVYSTVVPFTVAERCSVPPSPDECWTRGWRHDDASPDCDARVGPGTPGNVTFTMHTGTVLGGLQGRFTLDPAALQIVNLRPVGIAQGMRLAWNPRADGAQFVLFSEDGHTLRSGCLPPAACPPAPEPVLEVTVAPRPGVPIPPVTLLDVVELLASDTLGREVGPCPTFAPIAPARLCAGRSCDFNADGRLDVRDLVLMARCVTGHGTCPDSAGGRFDCNGDGTLGVDDVLCCARVILRGNLPDSVAVRPTAGLSASLGSPAMSSSGLDVPLHLNGSNLVGAARFALSYPADRFAQASVEVLGDASSWMAVSEMRDGELIVGLVALAPAEALASQLDLRVHLGAASGATPTADVQMLHAEFAGPDGAVITPVTPPTGVPPGDPRLELSTARPNPFGRETRFAVSLAAATDVDLGIFDLAGRRVATLHRGSLAAGEHSFVWNATRDDGTRAADGVYFYRAQSGSATATRRLVLISSR